MGNADSETTADVKFDGANTTRPSSLSGRVICEELLKVLGRKEVEQPMIWYSQRRRIHLRPFRKTQHMSNNIADMVCQSANVCLLTILAVSALHLTSVEMGGQ